MSRAWGAVIVSLLTTGCGHEVRREPVVVTPPASVATDAGAGGTTTAIPTAFRGPFHLPGHVDSINLVLENDGSFRWRIFGCDFGGGGDGVWKSSGPDVVLSPSSGATFPWMDDVSFVHAASKVTLRARQDGGLDVEATVTTPSDAWAQTWKPGRVCAQCGGGLGPDKMPKPCNQPIPPAGASFGE